MIRSVGCCPKVSTVSATGVFYEESHEYGGSKTNQGSIEYGSLPTHKESDVIIKHVGI